MDENKKSRKTDAFKLSLLFVASFILGFTVFTLLFFPVFNGKSGLEVIQETLSGVETKDLLADDPPVEPEPYFYEDFIPPSNSFGMDETTFKTVNWSFFWQKFRRHSAWNMEGWHPVQQTWVDDYQGTDLDDYLNISRIRSDDNASEKVTLNFTSPFTTKYRFTFGIDARVLNYVNKTDRLEYTLTYPINGTNENYTVFFNWSDLIPMLDNDTIRVNHGIKNINGKDVFWFRIITNVDLQEGESYELDPTFGYKGSFTGMTIHSSGNCYVRGYRAGPGETGYLENFSFYLTSNAAGNTIQMGLYKNESNTITDRLSLSDTTSTTTIGYHTLTANTKCFLEDDEEYYIVITTTTDVYGTTQIAEVSSGSHVGAYGTSASVISLSDPASGFSHTTAFPVAVYCGYIPGWGNTEPSITNPNPSNNAYNISLSQVYNVTVTDVDGNNSNVSFYISTDNSTWTHLQKNTSVLNESVSVDLNGHITLYDTIYYMKTTANDTQNNISFYSSFETTPYTTNYFNTTFPSENWKQSTLNMSYAISYYNTTGGGVGAQVMNWFDGFEKGFAHQTYISTEPSDYWNHGGLEESWWYGDGYTTSSSTGCGVSTNKNPFSGDDVLYTETSSTPLGSPPAYYAIVSNSFTVNSTDNITVDFRYHMYGDNDFDWCSVQIGSGSSWDDLWNLTSPSHTGYADTDPWDRGLAYSESGANYPYSGTYQIRFLVEIDATFTGDFCLDHVYINKSYSASVNDAEFISENISRQDTTWDKFYAQVNNTANSTFSLIDPYSIRGWYGVSSSELIYASYMGDAGTQLDDALDGTDYWYDASPSNPLTFIIDIGSNQTITKFRGRSECNGDPTDVSIWVSRDNSTWGSPVVSNISTWQDTLTWVEADSTDKVGRYIKVIANSYENSFGEWGEPPAGSVPIFDVYTDYTTIISGLNGDGDDISSVTNSTVRVKGEFNATLSLDSINLTWTAGGEPPDEQTWNVVINTINGSFSNSTNWKTIINTINGSYSNTTTWNNIISTINGTYTNSTPWNIIISTINGSYSNSTGWKSIDNTINGSYSNTTTWNNIINTINGSYSNITTWNNIINTINGSYSNTTEKTWDTITSAINGTYSNSTFWTNIISTINGTYSNDTITWTNIINTINGTYSNTTETPTINLTNPYPSNTTTIYSIYPSIHFTINHTTGQKMNYTLYWNTSTTIDKTFDKAQNITNGTYHHVFENATTYQTTYYWKITYNDGTESYVETFSFTTSQSSGGHRPKNIGLIIALGMMFAMFGFVLMFLFNSKKKKNRYKEEEEIWRYQ